MDFDRERVERYRREELMSPRDERYLFRILKMMVTLLWKSHSSTKNMKEEVFALLQYRSEAEKNWVREDKDKDGS